MKNTVLALLVAFCVFAAVGEVHAAGPGRSPVEQGTMVITGGPIFGTSVLGGLAAVGYFVADRFMVGARYSYWYDADTFGVLTPTPLPDGTTAWEEKNFSSTWHGPNLELHYYLSDKGSLYPFLAVDGGYQRVSVSNDAETKYDLFSLMGGAGLMAFMSRSVAAQVTLGWRYVFDPPEEFGIDSGYPEISFGVVFYFGGGDEKTGKGAR